MTTFNTNKSTVLGVALGIFGVATSALISTQNYGLSSSEPLSNTSYYSSSQSICYGASSITVVDSKVAQFFSLYPEVRNALNKLDDVTERVFGDFESRFEVVADWDTDKDILAWHITTKPEASNSLTNKENEFFSYIDERKLAEQLLDVVIYIG